jgi:hypothetical protein
MHTSSDTNYPYAAEVAYPLPVLAFMQLAKKCCKSYKKGKRCKKCPAKHGK